ncbi:acetyl-CoA synthetase-like protein [Periconia macrospinosa]|uniref:Acetyl-CoA synthetase-like protein n=1 Tax=Periconia macrospinosa TaxID=97972 RepID=A0A2V1DHW8_9PLEO|nr:acetyl-CoA synthetase-like protein [Periconia macrospinosa]
MATENALAESYGLPSRCDTLLWDTLQEIADTLPDSIALISAHQQKSCLIELRSRRTPPKAIRDCSTWTYAQLMKESLALADQLFDLGLRAGDTFVAFMWNSVEWAALLWACARLQVAFAPLNPNFLERPEELGHIMNTLLPKGIMCADGSCTEIINVILGTNQRHNVTVRIYLHREARLDDGWLRFADLGFKKRGSQDLTSVFSPPSGDIKRVHDPALVFATSGTTDLPKACPHTSANLYAASDVFRDIRLVHQNHRFLVLGPLFHIQAVWNVLVAWRAGATVCLPSPTFDAGEAIRSLRIFRCSHISCGPSMIAALLAHPDFSTDGYEHIQSMALGSDLISRDLVELCKKTFRAQNVYVGWGMSETVGGIVLGAKQDVIWHDGTPTIGYVTPGSSVRVCKPGSHTLVKKGETGELHIEGNSTTRGYVNGAQGAQNDAFYSSDGRHWFATGDLALMDSSGAIFVKGRIKDMIIRGGEKISPVAVENCINTIEGVKVIGISDPIMGQVPVAVIATELTGVERTDLTRTIQRVIKHRFGNSHRLRQLLTLGDLKLSHFPTTATGKVKKGFLRNVVEDFVGKSKILMSEPTATLAVILAIWKELLAADDHDITQHISVTKLADSLTMLRFCFEVERRLNKHMTVAEVLESETPIAQAKLLDSRQLGQAQVESKTTTNGISVWTHQAQKTKEDDTIITDSVRSAIDACLQSLGASWSDDVEAVYEPHEGMDMFLSSNARPSSCNVRWALEITQQPMSVQRIYESMAQALERHAALRAVVVPLEKRSYPFRSIHVVLKANERWLQHAVKILEPLERPEDLVGIIDQSDMAFGGPGRQSLHACIVPLVGSNTKFGLCLSVCHAAFDAISMAAFLNDFQLSLRQESLPSQTPVPYMAFAEAYRIHKNSALGKSTAMYHINKFISSNVPLSFLWPPLKGPGCFIGSDVGWKLSDGSLGQTSDRLSLDATAGIPRGRAIHSKAKILGLQKLKSDHSIEPSIVFKTAVALFNTEQTGGDCALFKTTSAGRTWPFLEQWIAQNLPHPLGIAGPCLSWSIDCITTRDDQRLDQFLKGQRPALKSVGRLGFIDVGFLWNFGIVSGEEVAGFVLYDDVHLDNTQAKNALSRVFDIAQQLVKTSSWERTLGEVLPGIGARHSPTISDDLQHAINPPGTNPKSN